AVLDEYLAQLKAGGATRAQRASSFGEPDCELGDRQPLSREVLGLGRGAANDAGGLAQLGQVPWRRRASAPCLAAADSGSSVGPSGSPFRRHSKTRRGTRAIDRRLPGTLFVAAGP